MEQYPYSNKDTSVVTHEVPTNFVFKGKRNYVHGSDIYPAALHIARELWGRYPDEVIGTFHKLLKSQGIFRLRSDEKRDSSEDIFARFIFRFGESKHELVLNAANQPVSVTRPYDEEEVLRFSEMSTKSIRMIVRSDHSYIEQIIAMTKRLHHVVYTDVHDKWLFTKLHIKDRIDPEDYHESALEIRAKRKVQNILSQCSIFVNDWHVGHIFYSAVSDGKQS
ncbi:MAG: hypothetical protein HF982_00665 [Desulfobacteraceae bacterium]|nr:hypothetical protein [Desulfobacteraceae bacterium]MBC2718112.1 hypothetical protein [Desulfobacteraceae bacterium]